MRRVLTDWSFDRELVRPAVAPTIPHHCSDEFMRGCAKLAREFGVGSAHACAGVQGPGDRRPQEIRQDADRASAGPRPARARFRRRPRRVARRRRHRPPRRPRRLGGAQSRQQHAARQRHRRGQDHAGARSSTSASAPTAPPAATTRTCTNRCASPPTAPTRKGPDNGRWLASEEILEAATAGSARALGFGDRSAGSPRATRPTSSSSTSRTSTGSPATTPPTSSCTPRTAAPCIPSWSAGRMVVENRRPVGLDLHRSGQEGRGRARAPGRRQRRQQGPVRAPAGPRQRLLPGPRQDPLPHRPLRRRPSRALMAFTTRHPVRTGSDPSHPRSGKAPRSGRGV